MKKVIIVFCLISLFITSGCADNKKQNNQPDITQIRSICKLATLKTYYHNVAKSTKTAGTKLSNIGEKDREFWMEYTGYATIGIDMSKVEMTIKGDNVTITMPKPEIMDIGYLEETIDIISTDDSFINKNKITAKDQTKAIKTAQEKMKKTVKDNTGVMLSAQTRAESLIENYVKKLGEISKVDYKIIWNYLE